MTDDRVLIRSDRSFRAEVPGKIRSSQMRQTSPLPQLRMQSRADRVRHYPALRIGPSLRTSPKRTMSRRPRESPHQRRAPMRRRQRSRLRAVNPDLRPGLPSIASATTGTAQTGRGSASTSGCRPIRLGNRSSSSRVGPSAPGTAVPSALPRKSSSRSRPAPSTSKPATPRARGLEGGYRWMWKCRTLRPGWRHERCPPAGVKAASMCRRSAKMRSRPHQGALVNVLP
jgi:hypothetical protein